MPVVTPGEPPLLLSVRDVAVLLGCSPRHLYRLVDAGAFPKPIRLGKLIRWTRSSIEQHLDAAQREGARHG